MLDTLIHYGDGTQVRFECPGSLTKVAYVGDVLTVPTSETYEAVFLSPPPGPGVPVRIDWETGAGAPTPEVPPGGTAGQVLEKASGADFATQWVTPATGGGLSQHQIMARSLGC